MKFGDFKVTNSDVLFENSWNCYFDEFKGNNSVQSQ